MFLRPVQDKGRISMIFDNKYILVIAFCDLKLLWITYIPHLEKREPLSRNQHLHTYDHIGIIHKQYISSELSLHILQRIRPVRFSLSCIIISLDTLRLLERV